MSTANSWLRLWHDMPNDPKWRTISRVSKQPPALVIAVYLHVLVDASTNASERGRTQSLCIEDVATALDVEDTQVRAVLDAMQGRVMDGDLVTGWNKRQPMREDGAAARARAWRERKRTQANASKRSDADADTDAELKKEPPSEVRKIGRSEPNASERSGQGAPTDPPPPAADPPAQPADGKRASRLADDWTLPNEWREWAEDKRPGMDVTQTAESFADYWHAKPGKDGRKLDWMATWRNWVRNTRVEPPARNVAQPIETFRERDRRLAAERVAAFAPGVADQAALCGRRTIDMEASNAALTEGH